MARRSPMNERYQKNTAPAGKTRKSAASAKPKRSAAVTSAAKPAAKEKTSPILPNPDTDEFRYWRRIWWALLISSAVFTFGSLGVRQWLAQPVVANVLLFVGYTLIFAALAVDWMKIRKLRTEWIEAQKSGSKQKKSDPTS